MTFSAQRGTVYGTLLSHDLARLLHRARGQADLPSLDDEPDFAPLMDDMFFAQGSDIEAARFIAPRVEVELAFIPGRPLKRPGTVSSDSPIESRMP